jgi:FlaA1/EpsC-like NDP-sugar epimerase
MNAFEKILIVGAGDAGRGILAEYVRLHRAHLVAGFIDDDDSKIGKELDGKKVLGGRGSLADKIRELDVGRVVIALPSANPEIVHMTVAVAMSARSGIAIEILPSFTRYLDGALTSVLQDVHLADIIDREEYGLDVSAIEKSFRGRTVLITGAGGSIGSEICRQIARFHPSRIVCVGRGENSIYELTRSLEECRLITEADFVFRICDVKDYALLKGIFLEYKPDIVFHAAAHKHVPLMEFNEAEAIQNNVGGSNNVFHLSVECSVSQVILVSTDKAVNPSNVMGASKRLCELTALYYHRKYGLKVSIVRFGNVLGSRGSVIPLFLDQIKKGGPVTVTHPDVTRYFMSIPEAALLVINAGAYAKGGEIFVLEMGRQYRISDIAKRLIRKCGYEPERDIPIVYTGLRPGEKMFEELSYPREVLSATPNEKISVMRDSGVVNDGRIEWFIGDVLKILCTFKGADVRKIISEMIPEYTGK